jgi:hypothetical protein
MGSYVLNFANFCRVSIVALSNYGASKIGQLTAELFSEMGIPVVYLCCRMDL